MLLNTSYPKQVAKVVKLIYIIYSLPLWQKIQFWFTAVLRYNFFCIVTDDYPFRCNLFGVKFTTDSFCSGQYSAVYSPTVFVGLATYVEVMKSKELLGKPIKNVFEKHKNGENY